jgi:hypothetical protein
MEEALFVPIGMTSSGFGSKPLLYGEESSAGTAIGYYQENGLNHPYNQYDIIELASGNLHSTLRDMTAFCAFILAGGIAGGERIIDSSTLETMFTPQYATESNPQTIGLTWFTDRVQLGQHMVFHSGTNQGCISMIALLPDHKLGVVMWANSDEFDEVRNQLAVEILSLLLETKHGIKPVSRPAAPSVTVSDDMLETHSGTYIADGEIIEVAIGLTGLRARYGGISLRLKALSETRFYLDAPLLGIENTTLTFIDADAFGRKAMIASLGGSYHIVCPAYPDRLPVYPEAMLGTFPGTIQRNFLHPRMKSTMLVA